MLFLHVCQNPSLIRLSQENSFIELAEKSKTLVSDLIQIKEEMVFSKSHNRAYYYYTIMALVFR